MGVGADHTQRGKNVTNLGSVEALRHSMRGSRVDYCARVGGGYLGTRFVCAFRGDPLGFFVGSLDPTGRLHFLHKR